MNGRESVTEIALKSFFGGLMVFLGPKSHVQSSLQDAAEMFLEKLLGKQSKEWTEEMDSECFGACGCQCMCEIPGVLNQHAFSTYMNNRY